uniref:Thioredoxin n=1 Tax=Globisporangium ultimum (strain ATCC 200006 / CBS 805.95 / DAOM BR144) TaxID=431595 RepID=K3XAY0_GLOUD
MIPIKSPTEFNSAIQVQNDKVIVASFSAPWCGGCKTVAPHVAKLAEELKDTTFLKVNADDDGLEEFCDEIEVDGFPSFRIYKNGELVDDYTGSKPEKVEEFIRKYVN